MVELQVKLLNIITRLRRCDKNIHPYSFVANVYVANVWGDKKFLFFICEKIEW